MVSYQSSYNTQTEKAKRFHEGTKHPDGFLLNRFHYYNVAERPEPYKIYLETESLPLDIDKEKSTHPLSDSVLEIISKQIELNSCRFENKESDRAVPSIGTVSRLLYFTAGITKNIKFPYPLGSVSFRAASCTGALYHIEVYLVCKDIPGLSAGVYHFDPKNEALNVLRKGDYTDHLVEATGNESFVASSRVVFVFTDIFSRNSVKYQTRAYRHTFWDSGTMIANTISTANLHKLSSKLVLGFDDQIINKILGLNDTTKEASVALFALGGADKTDTKQHDGPALSTAKSELESIDVKTKPLSNYGVDYEAINEIHTFSSLYGKEEVRNWQKNIVVDGMTDTTASRSNTKTQQYNKDAGQDKTVQSPQESSLSNKNQNHPQHQEDTIKLQDLDPSCETGQSLEKIIIKRGSPRNFSSEESLGLQDLANTLKVASKGIDSDFVTNYASLIDIYIIANNVQGFSAGSYYYDRTNHCLVPLVQNKDLRKRTGQLSLGQHLAVDCSVALYFLADLDTILERFGNRGYRTAQLEAAIMGGKCYLASYAQGFGATGLTFYDDMVTEFFSPHAAGKQVMFHVAIGRKPQKKKNTHLIAG